MIVKNESNVIIETLKNLLDYIDFDYWVISDTGSTDNTQQIIKDFFYDKCIPGEIFNDEWRDFGYNRSKALEHAYGKTDYLLVFDADDRIEGKFVLPFSNKSDTAHDNHNINNHNQVFFDAYMLKIGTGFEYVRPLLLNNNKKCLRFLMNLHRESNINTYILKELAFIF
jgi:glycosyltransferase involved in cell wall biosynthesis